MGAAGILVISDVLRSLLLSWTLGALCWWWPEAQPLCMEKGSMSHHRESLGWKTLSSVPAAEASIHSFLWDFWVPGAFTDLLPDEDPPVRFVLGFALGSPAPCGRFFRCTQFLASRSLQCQVGCLPMPGGQGMSDNESWPWNAGSLPALPLHALPFKSFAPWNQGPAGHCNLS